MDRRRFFATASLAALAAVLLPARGAAAVSPAGPDLAGLRRLPSGHYVLNNWVLTAGDVEALGLAKEAEALDLAENIRTSGLS